MGSYVGDRAVLQQGDLVCQHHRRRAVRDHDAGGLGEHVPQCFLDQRLGVYVESGQGVVQHQYSGLGEHCAGQSEPLALTARQRHALLTDPRLQAPGQLVGELSLRDFTLERLRSFVATAFEEPTLFSMSARENLTLGRADATEEEVASALEVSQAGFVHDLPWGLDTRIGEQGMALSGGQRQRLALARAVLAQPNVLVLDDTLSALDVHTEKLVEEALRRVLASTTGLVVAHRASTVLLADRVALLQDGTITHVGEHRHLLATVPAYRDLLAAETEDLDEEASA